MSTFVCFLPCSLLTRVSSHCLFTSLTHLFRERSFILTSSQSSSPAFCSQCYLGSTRCSEEGDGWDPEWDKVSENSDVVDGEADEEDPAKAELAEEMEADMETARRGGGGRKSMSLRYSRNRPSIDTKPSSPASPGSCVFRLSPGECLTPTQRLFDGELEELVTERSCEDVEFNLSLLPPLLRLLSIVVCVVACTVGMGREEGLW